MVVCLLMFWLRLSVASVASRLLGSLPHNDWTIHCDRGGPDTSVGPIYKCMGPLKNVLEHIN